MTQGVFLDLLFCSACTIGVLVLFIGCGIVIFVRRERKYDCINILSGILMAACFLCCYFYYGVWLGLAVMYQIQSQNQADMIMLRMEQQKDIWFLTGIVKKKVAISINWCDNYSIYRKCNLVLGRECYYAFFCCFYSVLKILPLRKLFI